jgi:anaerobic magnesium-protoporphyrin IX monomethyl ester cyclase
MDNKKIYLLSPHRNGILNGNSQSLLYLAAWIKKFSSHEVHITKNSISIPKDADFVGISVTTQTYQNCLNIAKMLKSKNPLTKIIFGGYHTKGQGEVISKAHPEIDYIIEGEGEKAFVSILYGKKDKIIAGIPLTSEELDSISITDLASIESDYFKKSTQSDRINYSASRGCPHRCSFCASGEGKKPRAKSVKKVIVDLNYLAKKGFTKISIQDNFFGYDNKRMEEICKGILDRGIKIDFDCQTRVESMQNLCLLQLAKQAGCSAIYLGTENFSPDVIKKMNKSFDSKRYLDLSKTAIKNLLEAGIKPYFNLQVGFAYEHEKIREENIKGLKEIAMLAKDKSMNIQLFVHLNVIYPGTPDFESLKASGVASDIFESFTKWEEENWEEIKKLLKENQFIYGAGGIPLGILDFEELKQGKFVVDKKRIEEINHYIDRIRKIDGIECYGD